MFPAEGVSQSSRDYERALADFRAGKYASAAQLLANA
jgi:hypothetical protein